MEAASTVLHRYDAAVAAAHAATHDPFDRHFALALVRGGGVRDRFEHAFRSACVHDDRVARGTSGKRAIERGEDASVLTGAAVLGRQHELDAFVTAFMAGAGSSDFDLSGFVDVEDFNSFVQAFELGC